MEIAGVVALVTGGASGLGRATVEHLHAAGAAVAVLDVPSSDGAEVVERLGKRAVFAPDAAAGLGRLGVVVNCAGVAPSIRVVGRRGTHPLPDFTRAVMVNLVGTFNVLRLAAARMVDDPGDPGVEERGVIVNTASVAAFDGQIGQAAYAASKGGVVGMTLPVARDLAAHRIRVVTIAPGIFETPMLAGLPDAARDSLGQQVPHPARLGRPAEYASLVGHIIANPMLNGETIRLDGAIRMAPR